MNLISEIQAAWGWVGIHPTKIVGENAFGNLVIEDIDGKYWRLSPEDVYCKIIAENRDGLDQLSRDKKFLLDWNMSALVDLANQAVGELEEGRKYCLVIPAVLGGTYDASNIKSVTFIELIRFSGNLGEQIRDLPDGQKIELKIID